MNRFEHSRVLLRQRFPPPVHSSRILLASRLLFLIFLYVVAGHFASIYSVSDLRAHGWRMESKSAPLVLKS